MTAGILSARGRYIISYRRSMRGGEPCDIFPRAVSGLGQVVRSMEKRFL